LDNGSAIIYKQAGESFLILMRRVSSLQVVVELSLMARFCESC